MLWNLFKSFLSFHKLDNLSRESNTTVRFIFLDCEGRLLWVETLAGDPLHKQECEPQIQLSLPVSIHVPPCLAKEVADGYCITQVQALWHQNFRGCKFAVGRIAIS